MFLLVVKLGSFHKAAEALGLTQPTVSRRIARLEAALGVELVIRRRSGVTLTPEGQAILDDLGIANDAIHRVRKHRKGVGSKKEDVKLVITDGLATYWLPYFLGSFFDQYPNIELRIQTATETRPQLSDQFDLSIHYLQPTDPDLMITKLGTLHFVPYASSAYLARKGTPHTIAELSKHRLLDYLLYLVDKGSWSTRLPEGLVTNGPQLFTNSSASLAEAVRRGVGIALLPTYGAAFEEGFVPLEIGMQYQTPFWLCYRKEAAERPPVQIVLHFLKHIFNYRSMPWFGQHYVSPNDIARLSPDDIMRTFKPPEELVTRLRPERKEQ
ncbi:MAG TPA: LysR family transcriptional regulator [Rhizomicrobium sp.]|nr:LysR family transcriptional regulator [Rhizomicrobium sp.]